MTTTIKTDKATKPIDEARLKAAVTAGKASILKGETKADASRVMFEMIKRESREIIVSALIQGAGLTEKGSMTYYYNLVRKAKQSNNKNVKDSSSKSNELDAKN